ncbi:alpha/beta hydrolase [Pseudochrobactrum asaccharolyticum]|uniref:alpha/beta hydrolase n=1 Tax=Pseudochrobactrum asaccharolyticum TaxID=354351 RepID=UPI0040434A23
MYDRHISDWDNAYANGIHIVGGDQWGDIWQQRSEQFRIAKLAVQRANLDVPYGEKPRNIYDLFMPEGEAKGLVVFIHGGFWTETDKSYWSYLANGSVAHGFAVAMPSYTLCPEATLSGIAAEVAQAIEHAAARIAGPIYLAGHSAGGQLAGRMMTVSGPLSPLTRQRIRHVLSISGLHDLRPLMQTEMNTSLHIDENEALAESPALLRPCEATRLTCWYGSSERPEFIRQSKLLANIWLGLGATTTCIEEMDKHHFDVLDGLSDPSHPLIKRFLFSE